LVPALTDASGDSSSEHDHSPGSLPVAGSGRDTGGLAALPPAPTPSSAHGLSPALRSRTCTTNPPARIGRSWLATRCSDPPFTGPVESSIPKLPRIESAIRAMVAPLSGRHGASSSSGIGPAPRRMPERCFSLSCSAPAKTSEAFERVGLGVRGRRSSGLAALPRVGFRRWPLAGSRVQGEEFWPGRPSRSRPAPQRCVGFAAANGGREPTRLVRAFKSGQRNTGPQRMAATNTGDSSEPRKNMIPPSLAASCPYSPCGFGRCGV
jgi:hypothetical protein